MGGAGSAHANGWYYCREANEGPPRQVRNTNEEWISYTRGRPWYEKDDGHYMYISWRSAYRGWRICHDEGIYRRHMYHVKSQAALPPTGGWKVCTSGNFPIPTFRV